MYLPSFCLRVGQWSLRHDYIGYHLTASTFVQREELPERAACTGWAALPTARIDVTLAPTGKRVILMRISEQGRAQVRPRDFWLIVLSVTLVLGGAGVYEMQTGHLPAASSGMAKVYHGFEISFLLVLWGAVLFRSVRKPRRVYRLTDLACLVGCTLVFGSDLISGPGRAAGWVKNTGMLLILLDILPYFVTFGKRRPPTQPVDTPSHPVP